MGRKTELTETRARRTITRRDFVAGAAALTGGLLVRSAGGEEVLRPGPPQTPGELVVPPDDALDLFIERSRVTVGEERSSSAITVNGSIPGPVLRMREGQNVTLRVHNRLGSEDTSVHWHGLILPTDMDGVPGVSFPGIRAGDAFTYRFRARQSGTYWYHSHSGLQEQLGHYGAIIIDPVEPEPFTYDLEYVIVLSDWTFEDPNRVLEKLKTFEGYYNYQRPTIQNLFAQAKSEGLRNALRQRFDWAGMRMDPTDIADVTGATYTYLMNGKPSRENWTAVAKPGQKVRLRLINAATMTYFDFRIPGLPMTVVAADGQHVTPVQTDELRIAVAETYDVLVTLPDDRAYPLFAETMDRSGSVRGTLAPRHGMSSPVPERRRRPMLTMADMGMAGMAHGESDMKGMDMSGARAGGTEHGAAGHGTKPAVQHATGHEAMPPGKMLPTEHLPESLTHGPDNHGVNNSMTAMTAKRRFGEAGVGLGTDGWRVLKYGDLRALKPLSGRRAPDREFELHLTGNMSRYVWGFDGKKFSEADVIRFAYGERVRINMVNDTMMEHPIHLHGMWMDLYAGGTLDTNPRKHTVSVKPGELLTVDVSADAPGRWALHCHLLYHMDAGMFRTVAVVRSLDGGKYNAK